MRTESSSQGEEQRSSPPHPALPAAWRLQALSTLLKHAQYSTQYLALHCSPVHARAEAILSYRFLALHLTFFHIRRTDPTNTIQALFL